jgi:SAM-dependent methyltransferase
VLDVACGTGVLAREALRRVRPGGAVTGLDRNEGMLAVARRNEPAIDWRAGRAESLPFEAGSFDAVVSQFGLMFFEDRAGALREMWRVLKPSGRLAVAVRSSLDRSPGYAAMVKLLQSLFGDPAADQLRAPFVLGDHDALRSLFSEAGIPAAIEEIAGQARFPSVEAWVHTDIRGWTLADMIDDAQYATLLEAARKEFRAFVQPDGTVAFASPARIATARKS